MTILLPALAVAFAAFCVWLTVRTVNRRERWVKSTLAVIVGLPVLYVASFGPACWWLSKTGQVEGQFHSLRFRTAHVAYWPMGHFAQHGSKPVHNAIRWYATLGLRATSYGPHFALGITDHENLKSFSAQGPIDLRSIEEVLAGILEEFPSTSGHDVVLITIPATGEMWSAGLKADYELRECHAKARRTAQAEGLKHVWYVRS